MLALWIVLAVVLVTLVVGLVVAVPRRRRGRLGRGEVPSAAVAPVTAPAPAAVPAPPTPEPLEAESPDAGPETDVGAAPELRERMGKTRGLFSGYVRSLRSRSSVDDQAWDDLEEALLRADVGVATTTALLEDLRARVRDGELRGAEAVVAALREDLRRSLDTTDGNGLAFDTEGPCVWLFVGVNGVGKTTTIGKVARREKAAGRSVLLAAGDTFRAAAAEQLEHWAQRTGVEIVRGAEGGDPSAVVFDAVQRAQARGNDLVLADTAGRLHTKVNLVEELKKIRRVADRPPGHVTEVLLVLDATTGQNGLTQARQFLDAVGVTGVVLTKLDGSAKGGIVIAIQRELGLPVKLVGLGEGPDDLVPFDADEFVAALFD
ncbi:MAG TPA: signal recognition particle-docking protein FtsY [Acidimicrobiales bacterium]